MQLNGIERVRGFTLLEVMIVAAMVAAILLMSMSMTWLGVQTAARSSAQSSVQGQARNAVEAIARELKDSSENSSGWEIGENPTPYDEFYGQDVGKISFSRCVGYDAELELLQWSVAVTYEFTPPDGDEPGKLTRTINGIRMVVCDRVSAFIVNYSPDAGSCEITVTVSTTDPVDPGLVTRASYSTSQVLRN